MTKINSTLITGSNQLPCTKFHGASFAFHGITHNMFNLDLSSWIYSTRDARDFRDQVGGHYASQDVGVTGHQFDRRVHGSLHDPRIYPTILPQEGPHPYGRRCSICDRPHRIFQDQRIQLNHWHSMHLCSLCGWKLDNNLALRLDSHRLWPFRQNSIRTTILTFLCAQGDQATFVTHDCGVFLHTPQVDEIFLSAQRHTWHSILYSGLRRACLDFCEDTGASLTRDLRPGSHPVELWGFLIYLCENPFWRLHISCSPLRGSILQDGQRVIVPNVAEFARPMKLIIELLGAHGGGQHPPGVLVIDKFYLAHRPLRHFSMRADSLMEDRFHC